MQGMQVQFLVRELRSHMPLSLHTTTREAGAPQWRPSAAKIKKKKYGLLPALSKARVIGTTPSHFSFTPLLSLHISCTTAQPEQSTLHQHILRPPISMPLCLETLDTVRSSLQLHLAHSHLPRSTQMSWFIRSLQCISLASPFPVHPPTGLSHAPLSSTPFPVSWSLKAPGSDCTWCVPFLHPPQNILLTASWVQVGDDSGLYSSDRCLLPGLSDAAVPSPSTLKTHPLGPPIIAIQTLAQSSSMCPFCFSAVWPLLVQLGTDFKCACVLSRFSRVRLCALLCPSDSADKNARVGSHFPPPGGLPDPGTEPMSPASPALQTDSLPTEPPGKPDFKWSNFKFLNPPSLAHSRCPTHIASCEEEMIVAGTA